MEHELWFTGLLNKLLAVPVSALLVEVSRLHGMAWVRPADPAHPIPNYVAMEVMILLLLIAAALTLRRRLSVENPGKAQHLMEVIVQFTQSLTEDIIGPTGRQYLGMIGTLGLFIALCNLWGLVPGFSTPTARIQVTLGCAVAAFIYYNYHGIREHGALGYLRHLCGPMLMMAVLMLPIEIISNLGRLLSLSVRLQANMLVGSQLEKVFAATLPQALESLQGALLHALGAVLGPVISVSVPPLFMGLHIFESFLQAYVFMLLPAVYISLAVTKEH
jgi:F-type H+-transporting ATPase subunit a